MDLSIIIPGIIIFASVAVPVVYLNKAKARAEKKLVKVLNQFAASHNSTLSEYECLQSIAVGMDKKLQTLFYVQQKKGETVKRVINLDDVRKSEVVEDRNDRQNIERLLWVFLGNTANEKEVTLEFYNASTTNFSMAGELEFVRKWQDKVAAATKHTKKA